MSVREDIAGLLHEFRMGTYNTENLNMAEIDLWKADQILSHPRIAILAENQNGPMRIKDWRRIEVKRE